MIPFSCDYECGAHPAVLRALEQINLTPHTPYGEDECCRAAADMLRRKAVAPQAQVHFLPGGTITNLTLICSALRPHQAALCAGPGHIFQHETGAIEATGHKVLTLPGDEGGRLNAGQIADYVDRLRSDDAWEHIARPALVYLSHPTEYGALYTRESLEEISAVCRERGLLLYVDGARLSYALAAEPQVSLSFLASVADAFTFGGTKCGTLMGEALLLINPALQQDFRSILKQRGGMLAKGWLLGAQMEALLRDDMFLTIAAQANAHALRIRRALTDAGCRPLCDSRTNQQFFLLPIDLFTRLSSRFTLSDNGPAGEGLRLVRVCTSWATTGQQVNELLAAITE